MFGGPCMEGGNGFRERSGPVLAAALVAAAGLFLTSPAFPLMSRRAETGPPAPIVSAARPVRQAQGPPAASAERGQSAPQPSLEIKATRSDGERFFADREAGLAKVACADCHLATDPSLAPPDDRIRPGHSVFDAFGRGTWWNGRVTTDCGEAADVCFKRYQGGEALDAAARVALVKFMKGLGPPVSNPRILDRVPPGRTEWSQGDAGRGQDLFRRACAFCHPSGGGPSGPDLATSKMSPREISDLVRTGKNRMPLFQGDVLTDAQVADVAAYGHSLQPKAE